MSPVFSAAPDVQVDRRHPARPVRYMPLLQCDIPAMPRAGNRPCDPCVNLRVTGVNSLDCVLSSLVWLIKCASRDDARTKMVVMRKIGRPVRVRRNRSASRRQHLRSAPRDCKATLSSPSCARRYHMSHSTLRQRTPSRIAAPSCRTGDGANLTRSGKSPRNSAPRTMRLRRFLRNDAPA